ncbi:uncharacterized protein [Epargyreus clarus]|uniref:uncharacterized protein isoform X2 n=1 Tax=Epargyreus clarus TaxID=520877 RepID=UPI003C3057B8
MVSLKAKGVLDEPFLKLPSQDELPPLQDDESSDGSFTEVEYLVIDSESTNTKVLYGKRNPSQVFSDNSVTNIDINNETSCVDSTCNLQMLQKDNIYQTKCKPTIQSYDCPFMNNNYRNCNECNENYQYRANNLVMKLRELKKQNVLLHEDLAALKEESKKKNAFYDSLDDILKIDMATNTCNYYADSKTTLTSLKCKLQEVQCSRNNLIETVSSLQDKLDHFDELKKHELEEIEAKHKLELIKLKTSIREEVKVSYESKLDELKKHYENLLLEIQTNTKEEIEIFYNSREQIILEKDKLLQSKEAEICELKCQIEELKSHQFAVLNRFIDRPVEKSSENLKNKTHELEKRLYKMERTKNKCAKAYEDKIASMQREKHLAECSLQLQLVKQRAQFVNEVTDENKVELATALDKLENKYKEIVANVQATAVQRRLQDQIALESLIQAVCGTSNGNTYANTANKNTGQFSGKSIRNRSKDRTQRQDREIETLCNSNRVENVLVGNKSFGEDSVVTGYCLDSEKLQELFERVHIPQRDVGDVPK